MKKVVVLILLILTCSIIVEQYLYYQTNKQIYTEVNIPENLPHSHFGDYSDCHEFVVINDFNLNFDNLLLSENIIYPINSHPQKSLSYIWQPPEMML
jgi:hypothetical protein